jgi:hypothetical protein
MGRKSRLTPEVQAAIVAGIEAGLPKAHAAYRASVSAVAVDKWIERGEKDEPDEPYTSFAMAVRQAQAVDVARSVSAIVTAEPDDWKAAAWRLERMHPKSFGAISRHQLTGADDGPIKTSAVADLTDEDLAARVREIMDRERGDDE